MAAGVAWPLYRRRGLGRMVEHPRRYSAPTATLYDAVTAPLLGRLFARVAHKLLRLQSSPPH